MNKTKKVIDAIAAEIKTLAQSILDDKSMGLRDSVLRKDLQIIVRSYDHPIVIETVLNDYVEYLEHDRPPKTGKQPPIDALRDWALARGIDTDNSTLFLISRAIWEKGHRGRPILATLEEEMEKRWENDWAEMIVEALLEEIELN